MLDENDIPEEINYFETIKLKNKAALPIDMNIHEELPVTESQEWAKIRDKRNPNLSKVIDETHIYDKDEHKLTEEFKMFNYDEEFKNKHSPTNQKFTSRKRQPIKKYAFSKNGKEGDKENKVEDYVSIKLREDIMRQKTPPKKAEEVEKPKTLAASKSEISKTPVHSNAKMTPATSVQQVQSTAEFKLPKSDNERFESLYQNKSKKTPKPKSVKDLPAKATNKRYSQPKKAKAEDDTANEVILK